MAFNVYSQSIDFHVNVTAKLIFFTINTIEGIPNVVKLAGRAL